MIVSRLSNCCFAQLKNGALRAPRAAEGLFFEANLIKIIQHLNMTLKKEKSDSHHAKTKKFCIFFR